MKLLSVFICGTLVAVLLAQSEEFDDIIAEGSGSDSTATTPSIESPTVTKSSPSNLGNPTASQEPTGSPVNGGSGSTESTELPESTTPETPVDRQVSFKVDCSQGDQCDFTFKIAEQLMRYVNTTYLEELLGQLAVKIQTISTEVGQLTTEEASYETLLTSKLDDLSGSVDETFNNVTDITDTVDDLQSNIDSIADMADKYYKAALCFQNNADTSENCGEIAFGGATTDSW